MWWDGPSSEIEDTGIFSREPGPRLHCGLQEFAKVIRALQSTV